MKQAPWVWFDVIAIVIISLDFCPYDHDFALFIETISYGCILLLLYFDDMIITNEAFDALKLKLS